MEGLKFLDFAKNYIPSQQSMPVLLVEQIATSDSQDTVFRTAQAQKSGIMLVKEGRTLGGKPLENALIFDFHQFERSARTGISVGRTSNNKIYLSDNAISKMHASFKLNTDDTWTIVDVESENGTRINGEEIDKNKSFPLKNASGITFADVFHCTFFLPDGFKEYLTSIGF